MNAAYLDRSEQKGAQVAARLEGERIAWLSTVTPGGTVQSSPIWYLWDGQELLLYSLDSARVRNIAEHPQISFHLDSNGLGGDIVVVEGIARIDRAAPSAAENPDYLAKYGHVMEGNNWTPEWFAGRYSVPIRITPTKYRYW